METVPPSIFTTLNSFECTLMTSGKLINGSHYANNAYNFWLHKVSADHNSEITPHDSDEFAMQRVVCDVKCDLLCASHHVT